MAKCDDMTFRTLEEMGVIPQGGYLDKPYFWDLMVQLKKGPISFIGRDGGKRTEVCFDDKAGNFYQFDNVEDFMMFLVGVYNKQKALDDRTR